MADADTTSKAGTDVGLKVSQPFKDATTAADYELLFSSSWPALPIAYETTVDVAVSGNVTIDHNLGYVPLTLGYGVASGQGSRVYPNVNKTQAKVFANAGKLNIKCFAIDITKEVNYPFNKVTATPALRYDADFGIRVAKQGKDVSSKDLRDYVLHSRGASPLILQVKTTADTSGYITVTNPAGYTPWLFGYVNSPSYNVGFYTYAPITNQSFPQLAVGFPSAGSARIQLFAGEVGSIISLRDPLFASETVDVVY